MLAREYDTEENCLMITRDVCLMLSLQSNVPLESMIPGGFYTVGNSGIVFTMQRDREYYDSEFRGCVEKTCALKPGMTLPPDLARAVSKGQIMLKHIPKIYREEKICIKITKKGSNFYLKSEIGLEYKNDGRYEIGSTITFYIIDDELD